MYTVFMNQAEAIKKSIASHNCIILEISRKILESKHIQFKSRASFCLRKKAAENINTTYIDTAQLDNILEINTAEKYAIVEPSVTMGQLYDATSKFNLVIPVISEMKHMTIGGAIIGLWGESSSFNYGLIDETVIEFEAILGNGQIITVSEKENEDLFMGLPGSYGSVCMITKIKIKLIVMKPYVEITYKVFNTVDTYINTIRRLKNIDFTEGVCINKNTILMMTGKYTDSCKDSLVDLHSKYCPTYASHIYKLLEKNKNSNCSEYMTTKDYFFRWDKGAFFVTHKKFGDNLIMKYLLGNKINSKNLYKLAQIKLHNKYQPKIFQDVGVPIDKLPYVLDWLDKKINIYPLWLLPVRKNQGDKLFSLKGKIDDIFINIGIYGRENNKNNISELEHIVQAVGGLKCLYGKNKYSEETFWSIYDKKKYHELKEKYHSLNKFMDIYEKVKDSEIKLNHPGFQFGSLSKLSEKIRDIFYLLTH